MGEGIRKQGVNTSPNKNKHQLAHTRTNNRKVRAVTKATRPDRDIYGGKSAELVSALRKQEEAWGREQSRIEKARAYTPSGQEVYRNDNGTPKQVRIPIIARKGNVTTHIHPKQKGDDIAARIGIPLSNTDVKNAIKFGAKETRAVAAGYTFSMRPKDGKNWSITTRQFTTAYNKAIREYAYNVIAPLEGLYNSKGETMNPKRTKYQFNTTFYNRVSLGLQNYALKRVANEFGLIYTRRKR